MLVLKFRFSCTAWIAGFSLWLSGCQLPNHYLIYPDSPPPAVTAWEEDIVRGDLKIHMAWATPAGESPFRTVLVHPHGGKTTRELQGVIWDLAARGYLAVAADYKRLLNGKYQRNTFAWRDEQDVRYALDYVLEHPEVDRNRVALMGFSQGGMLSLLIAAFAEHKVQAVVVYYPVSDFNNWFARERSNFIDRWIWDVIRRHFYRESGATSEQEFMQILYDASPINHMQTIQAPVLLVHGDADTSARLEESQRLQQKLLELGKPVELLVVPDGVHIFNFRQEAQGRFAWEKTLLWLDRTLN